MFVPEVRGLCVRLPRVERQVFVGPILLFREGLSLIPEGSELARVLLSSLLSFMQGRDQQFREGLT